MSIRDILRPFVLILSFWIAAPAVGQETAQRDSLNLSLEQAIALASRESEEVHLARSRVDLAAAQVTEAWSAVLPQINGSVSYTRTLASVFDTGGAAAPPDSLTFDPDPNASLEERVRYLERNTPNVAFGALGGLFSDLPFGRENVYVAALSGSQLLFSGGRTSSALQIARDFGDAAAFNLQEELADVTLDVRSAYYQALFSQELVTISEAAIERAQRFLEEEQLRLRAGRASDLDVLRAEVELENLRPQLIEARNASELARLNLKRLINVPLDQPISLTTRLTPPPPEAFEQVRLDPEVIIAQRAAVEAAQEQVSIREEQVRIARASFFPTISLTTNYAQQLFPSSIFAFDEDWRNDWTVGLNVQIPIFQGMRRSAQVQQAQVERQQAELQLEQLRESIQLQYEQALGEKQRALADIEARQRTVDQAERVYQLTEMRYDEGLATQLDVFSAQLALLQARTNLAQALTNYYVADAGLDRALGVNAVPRIDEVGPSNLENPR